MVRMALAVAALCCLVPSASASRTAPRHTRPLHSNLFGEPRPAVAAEAPVLVVPGPNDELQITDETRVLLNGRPCRYRDVPAGAIVIGVELAADQRTVLTIQFRTR